MNLVRVSQRLKVVLVYAQDRDPVPPVKCKVTFQTDLTDDSRKNKVNDNTDDQIVIECEAEQPTGFVSPYSNPPYHPTPRAVYSDIDFVTDGCIIDIKCSVKPRLADIYARLYEIVEDNHLILITDKKVPFEVPLQDFDAHEVLPDYDGYDSRFVIIASNWARAYCAVGVFEYDTSIDFPYPIQDITEDLIGNVAKVRHNNKDINARIIDIKTHRSKYDDGLFISYLYYIPRILNDTIVWERYRKVRYGTVEADGRLYLHYPTTLEYEYPYSGHRTDRMWCLVITPVMDSSRRFFMTYSKPGLQYLRPIRPDLGVGSLETSEFITTDTPYYLVGYLHDSYDIEIGNEYELAVPVSFEKTIRGSTWCDSIGTNIANYEPPLA